MLGICLSLDRTFCLDMIRIYVLLGGVKGRLRLVVYQFDIHGFERGLQGPRLHSLYPPLSALRRGPKLLNFNQSATPVFGYEFARFDAGTVIFLTQSPNGLESHQALNYRLMFLELAP